MSLQKSGQRKKQSKIQAILGVTNRQVETNKETKNLKKNDNYCRYEIYYLTYYFYTIL